MARVRCIEISCITDMSYLEYQVYVHSLALPRSALCRWMYFWNQFYIAWHRLALQCDDKASCTINTMKTMHSQSFETIERKVCRLKYLNIKENSRKSINKGRKMKNPRVSLSCDKNYESLHVHNYRCSFLVFSISPPI